MARGVTNLPTVSSSRYSSRPGHSNGYALLKRQQYDSVCLAFRLEWVETTALDGSLRLLSQTIARLTLRGDLKACPSPPVQSAPRDV